jgi:hypothetical protein
MAGCKYSPHPFDEFMKTRKTKIAVGRETHEAPECMQRLLELAGGTNPFGLPMYRFVWGWNRVEWIGGRWTDRDENTGCVLREVIQLRQRPKYTTPVFNENRWYIERWYPAEWYGPRRLWVSKTIEIEDGRNIPALGPYPSRGDYEHFYTLESPRGAFRQLTIARALWLAGIVWGSEKVQRETQNRTLAQKKTEFAEQEQAQRRADLEAMDATIPAFDYQPFVTVR